MKSPKFHLKKKDLEEVINVPRLKSRWKDKVREAMRRRPLPDPLENLDFHVRLEFACTELVSEVTSGVYAPKSPLRLLSEKSKGLCRQLVIPSVNDALLLQTLSDALWEEIKTKAPSPNAKYAPNDHGFSKIIKGQSSEYGPISVWLAFQKSIFGFTERKKFIVVTDIANYYDFISYDHLRSVLSDLSLAREHSLDLLIYTLSHMLWQPDYMPRVQIGLPQMDLDGARLLAHSFLFEIDRFLISKSELEYARFMDDIAIGADDIVQAREIIRDLDLTLQTRQLRLNSGKTKILTSEEVHTYYRINENMSLDKLDIKLKALLKSGEQIDSYKIGLSNIIEDGLKEDSFNEGNGEKILKRLINYAKTYNIILSEDSFEKILYYWPGCRRLILPWWYEHINPENYLNSINKFTASGHIVDHITFVDIAVSVVCARLKSNDVVTKFIHDLGSSVDVNPNGDCIRRFGSPQSTGRRMNYLA
jgi:reverse transcriptase-like protein